MTNRLHLSVAVPLYNEEQVLPELLRRVRAVLDATPGGPHEMLFVNDGSTDRTLELLEEAAAADDRIVIVSLSRNFGHQVAITAALDHVTGDATVVIDGDLQDPPEEIPRLLEKHAAGYDVVYVRRARRKEPWWLRLSFFVGYRVLTRMASLRLPVDAGDFALMSKRVVEELRRIPEHHRYLRGLRSWVGFRQTSIVVERAARQRGKSKYGVMRLAALAFDGAFAFSVIPLRAAAALGTLAIALSTLFAAYALYVRIFLERAPAGFTALIFVVTFLAGVNLLFLGIIGEYLGRVYEEVKARPLYVVDKVIHRVAQPHVAAVPRTANQSRHGAESGS